MMTLKGKGMGAEYFAVFIVVYVLFRRDVTETCKQEVSNFKLEDECFLV